ncbi:vWA domain-containing protein [Desulfococcaceae bacterium HSG9]|nr:vWA domain-containing protein [Desulfococcaceae bacterium HSG9]
MIRLSSIFMTVLMLFFLCGCSEEPPPPKPPPTKPAVPNPSTTANKPPETTTRPAVDSLSSKVWPFVTNVQEAKDLAKNPVTQNYIVIFDGSGSMGDVKCSAGRKKISVAKEAVIEWSKTLPADANIGLVAFHNKGWILGKLGETDRQGFVKGVQSLIYGGKTPLSKAFAHAYKDITLQGQKQLGYGEYTIVVVTDGIANSPNQLSHTVKTIQATSPVTIYTIGFCIGTKHSLNQPGKTVYKAADNPESLRQGLKEVLAESVTFDDSEFN